MSNSQHHQHIEREWQSYRTRVMPGEVSAEQLQETRLAFWAGAVAGFSKVVVEAAALSDDAGEAMLSGIQHEFARFSTRANAWADGKGPPP